MIDDNRTILQEVMRIRKYLEENPIRNIFFINTNYVVGTIAYNVSDIYINSGLDVTASADDGLVFKNGYIGIIDSIGDEYVTVQGVQPFRGEKGDTGDTGATGVGISSIAKTGTVGLVDTYTITLTNGNTATFTVTNGADGQNGQNGADGADGVGIISIAKTETSGLVDTYTITLTNGLTTSFTVTNGANGAGVPSGGTDGQVLTKDGSADYATKWTTPSSGSTFSPQNTGDILVGGGSPLEYKSVKPLNIYGKNLLINPDFKINQRAISNSTTLVASDSTTYGRDRWLLKNGSSVLFSDYYVRIEKNSAIKQFIETNYPKLKHKYILCGVTFDTATTHSPEIEIKYYGQNEGSINEIIELTPILTKVITTDLPSNVAGGGIAQRICVYEMPKADKLEFSLVNYEDPDENTNIIYNAFCYPISSYNEYSIGYTECVVDEYNLELEKCKYYYESIQSYSINCLAVDKIRTYVNYSKKRITPTLYSASGNALYYSSSNQQSGQLNVTYNTFTINEAQNAITVEGILYLNSLTAICLGRGYFTCKLDAEIYTL